MSDRLSAERLRRIRDYYGDFPDLAIVLAELDAVTRERDDLQKIAEGMSTAISDARSILAARTNERDLAEIANSRLHATVDLLTRELDEARRLFDAMRQVQHAKDALGGAE